MKRLYRSGSRWAFWRWTLTDSEYITRLHIVKTPWFAVCLHWINKPDPEPFLHDHPVSFVSLVLRGWYEENRSRLAPYIHLGTCEIVDLEERETRRVRFLNTISASPDDRHTITAVSPGGALTLCFMGPKVREWGFHIPVDSVDQHGAPHRAGWKLWKDYYRDQRGFRLL